MITMLDRYFSFRGRLARLPFFVRGVYVGIFFFVLVVPSIALFSSGNSVLWWAGLVELTFAFAVWVVGAASLIVRRLHDFGLAGYHAIWVGAAHAGWVALSYGPPPVVVMALPLGGIGVWLTFWPGDAKANRFGDAPE